MKIYNKLISGVLGTFFLVAIGIYISMHITKKTLKEQLGKEALLLTDHIMMEIDNAIYHRIVQMQAYAEDASLAREAGISNHEFDKITNVQDYINTIDKDWTDKENTPFISGILNNKLSRKLKNHIEFHKQIYGYNVFNEMYVTNKHGVVIASAARLGNYMQAEDEWYQKAIKEKVFWVDNIKCDEGSDTFFIGIAVNLYDESGSFAGLLKGILNAKDIKRIIDLIPSRSQYKNMKPFLVDRNGLTIFSGLNQKLKPEGKGVRLAEFGTAISLQHAVARAIKGNKGYIVCTEEGIELLCVFSHSNGFSSYKGLGWSIIIGVETAEVFRPIAGLNNTLLYVLIITIIIAVAFGISTYRAIFLPLIKLRNAALEIGKGRLDTKIKIDSKDEIGQLALSFNQMVEGLKRYNLELRESEQRTRAIVDNVVNGIITINNKGIIESFNHAAEQIFQYKSSEVIGKNVYLLMPEPHRSRHDQYIADYVRTRRPKIIGMSREEMGKRKDGTVFPLFLAVNEIQMADKIMFVGMVLDITARKKAEEEINKLSGAVKQSSSTIVITDERGIIEYVNPACLQLTGYKPEEVIGHTTGIFKSGKTPQGIYEELWKIIKSGKEWRGEFCNMKKNGELYWEAASISPVKNADGKITHFIAVKDDITKQKEMETQIIDSINEIKRAKELAEEFARKAEVASDVKSEFLARMSHDIRTPMNAIMGMSHLLSETALNPEQRKYIEIIQTSSDMLMALISDILNFSKLEAGKTEIEIAEFRLRDFIKNTVAVMEATIGEKELKLTYNINNDVPDELEGDKTILGVIINNLVGNAIKFTHRGAVRLLVENNPDVDEPGYLRFSVSDTGIGVPREKQDAIFDVFTQADSSTTRIYGGTGLGLSISKRLIELMGGRIWMESEPGRGSTFYFTLKFGISPESEKKTTAASGTTLKEEKSDVPGNLPTLNILLVDDSEDNIMLVQEFLKKAPFKIAVARNGKVAVERFKHGTFDLVLMDIQMPVMDGFTATSKIREWEIHNYKRHTIILALTADVLKGYEKKILDAGYDGLIIKPINKLKLIQTIFEFSGNIKK